MKKLIIFIILIVLLKMSAKEYIVEENGKKYKLIIDDKSGQIIEKKEIINEIKREEKITKIQNDPQLLKSIIPYNWQIGLYGFWQGFYYGDAIIKGFDIQNINTVVLTQSIIPLAMFFGPPFLLKENIKPVCVPIIDYGYRFGVGDYWLLRNIITSNQVEDYEYLLSVISGLSEAWGGYYLVKNSKLPRATGHFYSIGAIMGAAWGYGISESCDSLSSNIQSGIIFGSSVLIRGLGYKLFSNPNQKWKSFDAYMIALNSIVLPFVLSDILINSNSGISDNILMISNVGANIVNTVGVCYLMNKYNIHFNDGNTILMFTGAGLGAFFAGSIMFAGKLENISIIPVGMIAGEAIVYFLRKDKINNDNNNIIFNNIGFYIMPDFNNGIKASFSMNF